MMNPPLVWETADHRHEEKHPDWFWTVGLITGACAVAAAILSNPLFAILILLSGLALMMHAHAPIKTMRFEINRHGVLAGHHLYPYDTIDSFWIHEETHPRRVVLKSKNKMYQYINVPIGTIGHNQIRNRLLVRIPEVRHELSFFDALVEYIEYKI